MKDERVCREIEDLLALRPEDRSAAEESRLAAHLPDCAACRDQAAADAAQERMLRALPPLRPTPEGRRALRARIARERNRGKARVRLTTALRTAAGVAALAALVFALYLLFTQDALPVAQPEVTRIVATPAATNTGQTPVATASPTPPPLGGFRREPVATASPTPPFVGGLLREPISAEPPPGIDVTDPGRVRVDRDVDLSVGGVRLEHAILYDTAVGPVLALEFSPDSDGTDPGQVLLALNVREWGSASRSLWGGSGQLQGFLGDDRRLQEPFTLWVTLPSLEGTAAFPHLDIYLTDEPGISFSPRGSTSFIDGKTGERLALAPVVTVGLWEGSEVQRAIQAVLDREARAWRDRDLAAYQALLDPDADPAWRQERLRGFQSLEARMRSFQVQRVATAGEWALAAVMARGAAEEPLYVTRYLHQSDASGWHLTTPAAVPREALEALWGPRVYLGVKQPSIWYYSFDGPYLREVATHLEPYMAQVARDLGLSLADVPALELHVVPADTPFWDETPDPRLPSPNGSVGSPQEALSWGLYDGLAGQLIARRAGAPAAQDPWPALAEVIRQWEVADVRGTPARQDWLPSVRDRTPALPALMDPAQRTQGGAEATYQRLALVTFVVETYGRLALGPLVQALFAADDWQAVVRDAFGEEPARFEQRWGEWLDGVRAEPPLDPTPPPPPPPTPTRLPPRAPAYVVQPGDTLANIAAQHGISADTLMAANRLQEPVELRLGDTLIIPYNGQRIRAPNTFWIALLDHVAGSLDLQDAHGALTSLFPRGSTVVDVSWSPVSRHLLVVRDNVVSSQDGTSLEAVGPGEIWGVDLERGRVGTPRLLFQAGTPGQDGEDAPFPVVFDLYGWSPDGRRIILQTATPGPRLPDEGLPLTVLDVETGRATALDYSTWLEPENLSWAPDSSALAISVDWYASTQSKRSLAIYDVAADRLVTVVSGSIRLAGSMAWSPRGDLIACSAFDLETVDQMASDNAAASARRIYLLDPATGDYWRLNDADAVQGSPLWSEDGDILYYSQSDGQQPLLMAADPGSGAAKVVAEMYSYRQAPTVEDLVKQPGPRARLLLQEWDFIYCHRNSVEALSTSYPGPLSGEQGFAPFEEGYQVTVLCPHGTVTSLVYVFADDALAAEQLEKAQTLVPVGAEPLRYDTIHAQAWRFLGSDGETVYWFARQKENMLLIVVTANPYPTAGAEELFEGLVKRVQDK